MFETIITFGVNKASKKDMSRRFAFFASTACSTSSSYRFKEESLTSRVFHSTSSGHSPSSGQTKFRRFHNGLEFRVRGLEYME